MKISLTICRMYCYFQLKVLEDKPSSLPWLENKRLEEERERAKQEKQQEIDAANGIGFGRPPNQTPIVKPYVSGRLLVDVRL